MFEASICAAGPKALTSRPKANSGAGFLGGRRAQSAPTIEGSELTGSAVSSGAGPSGNGQPGF